MTIAQSTRLGPYEIGVPLGAGGMEADEEIAPPPFRSSSTGRLKK
jgi:hypothetical protein